MLLHSQNAQTRKTGGKQTKKETDLKKKKKQCNIFSTAAEAHSISGNYIFRGLEHVRRESMFRLENSSLCLECWI